ncbi:hypothetical protein FQA39_LY02053 [Lamprigera yunnana]|nr:hypothetical protein FQA39_LY02053 [Lamprigera yunnana]
MCQQTHDNCIVTTHWATFKIILITVTLCVVGHPIDDEKLPKSNPYDINDLNVIHTKEVDSNANDFETSLSYIDQTVREVEDILKANTSLPRLTRGEILQIIENITKTDLATTQKGKENLRSQKAVMLVMPYTPNNDDEQKMQELFTKPPITRMINDTFKSNNPNQRRRKPQQKQEGTFQGEVFLEPLITENITGETKHIKTNSSTLSPVYTHKPFSSNPTKAPRSTTIHHHQYTVETRYKSTSTPPTTSTLTFINSQPHSNIIRRRRPVQHPLKYSNHKYPEETPTTTPPVIFTTLKPVRFTYLTVADAKPSPPQAFTTPKPAFLDVSLPEELKTTLHELDIGDSVIKPPVPYDFFSLPNINEDKFVPVESVPPKLPVPDISVVADTLTPDMKELLMNFGLLTDSNQPLTNFKEEPFIGASTAEVNPNSYVQFKPLPDIGETSEEMQEFLGRFGLGKSASNNRSPKHYIPDPQKVLDEAPEVEFEMFPASMRDIIKNMGFIARDGKEVRHSSAGYNSLDGIQKNKKQHVFNPVKTSYSTQDEIDKLNQLMDIIRQLEKLNGTAGENLNTVDVDHINNIVDSLDQQKGAPDPVNFDSDVNKNKIKRQENTTTGSPTTVITVTPATTTQEARTPNIRDLEESFGGNNGAPEMIVTVPPPTQGPQTGLYYLVDWNTFLDIDDQKGKRVNIRFQPKTGDPRQFIHVAVP